MVDEHRGNPAVWCTVHAKQFNKDHTEQDNDGTQDLVTQYWSADCGCHVHIILALPTATEGRVQ
jgi:hypothetical protein